MAQKVKTFQPPRGWPTWSKRCGAKLANREGHCGQWAVVGMPTCKWHGSGGAKNRENGQLRYLAWVITGGPQNMRIEDACKIALNAWFDHVIRNSPTSTNDQMKAAMWLMKLIDD